MKVLVAFEDQEVGDLISFFLEGRFSISVVAIRDLLEGESLLAKDSEVFDALICDYSNTAKKLISFSFQRKKQFHIFCCTDDIPLKPLVAKLRERMHFVSETGILKTLEFTFQGVFNELGSEPTSSQEYYRVPIRNLPHANPLPGNLYVKLSDQKYVKIMREGFDFDEVDYDYFAAKKKISFLYIHQSHFLEFAEKINASIFKKRQEALLQDQGGFAAKQRRLEFLKVKIVALKKKLAEAKHRAMVEAYEKAIELKRAAMIQAKAQELIERKKKASDLTYFQAASAKAEILKIKADELRRAVSVKRLEKDFGSELEIIQSMSNRLGFTKEVQEITKQSVIQTIHTIRNTPKLSKLLLEMRRQKEKYISSHSMLLAYVSCALASQMEWNSDTTYQKLTMAAFLHDISLRNQEIAAIQSLAELGRKKSRFSEEDIRDFMEHPMVGADIARRFTEVPPDVDSIISQHHERPDGSGFPRGLSNSRIGPLATVFIVAHDLVYFLFKTNQAETITDMNLLRFLEVNRKTYQFGNFRKVLAAVRKIKT